MVEERLDDNGNEHRRESLGSELDESRTYVESHSEAASHRRGSEDAVEHPQDVGGREG